MIVKKSKFVKSLCAFGDFPGQGMPEIAMVGKSNVGKSSLINNMTGNSKLARTSSEPGKTRLVNLYLINEAFFLVDLPGYGFARAPKQEKQKWADMIEGYLRNSRNLKRVFQLVDIRHAPTGDDQLMVEYLRHYDRGGHQGGQAVQGPTGKEHSGDLPHPGRPALGGHGPFIERRHGQGPAAGADRGRNRAGD